MRHIGSDNNARDSHWEAVQFPAQSVSNLNTRKKRKVRLTMLIYGILVVPHIPNPKKADSPKLICNGRSAP